MCSKLRADKERNTCNPIIPTIPWGPGSCGCMHYALGQDLDLSQGFKLGSAAAGSAYLITEITVKAKFR